MLNKQQINDDEILEINQKYTLISANISYISTAEDKSEKDFEKLLNEILIKIINSQSKEIEEHKRANKLTFMILYTVISNIKIKSLTEIYKRLGKKYNTNRTVIYNYIKRNISYFDYSIINYNLVESLKICDINISTTYLKTLIDKYINKLIERYKLSEKTKYIYKQLQRQKIDFGNSYNYKNQTYIIIGIIIKDDKTNQILTLQNNKQIININLSI
jgi:hypothetical protein